ncbi:alpha/beta hydrolase [Sphingobium jiangsuense]|uniref:Pimeloyl-ACP methyl ester carboxylesterase n=1 Tax=Sphingobium jiangsuense TaxID=870476 RepID=A0A7W6BMT8_9SPHN|nr:alpha/beta hydrolase [Sphingobium jiangsuense]MBB3926725.1 pimeloyl-ACP methyl ester carboxylesterase [Sphingobium jiangsuense]GLT02405.1 alpha/beta hydrolase [Sphingobium jiangsuense]
MPALANRSGALIPLLLLAACAAPATRRDASAPVASSVPAASPDRMVEIDGARLRVRIEGPETAPPIVLIHGFTFSLETWDGWAADLARDHRVIRYDLSGHGLSDPDPQARYGTADRVRQLKALLGRLGIARATLAGNSFGGLVAWNFAALFPDRVDRLVLIDSAAYSINGVTERPVPVPPAMRAYLSAPSPQAVAFSAAQIFAHPERLTPQRLELMRAMIARPGNGPALISHLEQFTLPEPTAQLRRITAPTLILWGSKDKVVPVDHADRLAAAIPNARRIVYEDVGHAPQEEAADRSLADLRAFLNDKP